MSLRSEYIMSLAGHPLRLNLENEQAKKNICKITSFFFAAFDEDWKGNPDNPVGAEKHWGLYIVDRKPKLVMQTVEAN